MFEKNLKIIFNDVIKMAKQHLNNFFLVWRIEPLTKAKPILIIENSLNLT